MKRIINHGLVALMAYLMLVFFSPIILLCALGLLANKIMDKVIVPISDKIISYYEL